MLRSFKCVGESKRKVRTGKSLMCMEKALKKSSRECSYQKLQGSLFKNYVHLRDTFIFENTFGNKHLLSCNVGHHLRN
jgi:hypothetical protein